MGWVQDQKPPPRGVKGTAGSVRCTTQGCHEFSLGRAASERGLRVPNTDLMFPSGTQDSLRKV